MKNPTCVARTAVAVGLLALGIALAGCGGTQAAPPVPPEDFSGAYWVQALGTAGLSLPSVSVGYGPGSSDGVGTVTGPDLVNTEGRVATTSPFTFPYTVAPDGAFTLFRAPADATEVARGGIGHGEHVALVGSLGGPGILAFVRAWPHVTGVADLQGTWRLCGFRRINRLTNTALVGTLAFDGSGGVTLTTEFRNDDGTVSDSLGSEAGTYTVSSDGEIGVQVAGVTLRGYWSPDDELMLLGGGVVDGQDPTFFVLVPEAPASTTATFVGDYTLVGFDALGGDHQSVTGTLNADGTNDGTLTVDIVNQGGSGSGSAVFTYIVTDTVLVLTLPGEGGLVGAVSPAGRAFCLAGPVTSPNDGPIFWFGVRR